MEWNEVEENLTHQQGIAISVLSNAADTCECWCETIKKYWSLK